MVQKRIDGSDYVYDRIFDYAGVDALLSSLEGGRTWREHEQRPGA